jgi:hypothetical protein
LYCASGSPPIAFWVSVLMSPDKAEQADAVSNTRRRGIACPQRGPVPSPEPPPAVPSTPSSATAMEPPPPPTEIGEVAQLSPPTVLPLPPEEEARPLELTPSPASPVESAALAPARRIVLGPKMSSMSLFGIIPDCQWMSRSDPTVKYPFH